MQEVEISGRFVGQNKEPIGGFIEFIPTRMWLDEGEESYPPLMVREELDKGRFRVKLNRTDQHGLGWYYIVRCPIGSWKIEIKEDGPLHLKDLMERNSA